MVAAAKARGYAYMALTDHSQHVTIARGTRLARQIDEIDRLNDKLDSVIVLNGAAVDIVAEWTLRTRSSRDRILSGRSRTFHPDTVKP